MKITLCGSTKFKDLFNEWNLALSKAGHVVYSVAGFGHSGDPLTEEEKVTLDLVHLRKILESDAILVLNAEHEGKAYIGFSTKREIEWAQMNDKRVLYLDQGSGLSLLRFNQIAFGK